jgi:DNA adenine methylase
VKNKIFVPPIKCQGIKTKLVPLILANSRGPEGGRWIEPFMGSAVVGLNARPARALFADIKPHVIGLYAALKSSAITPRSARAYLEKEGKRLEERGGDYYYFIRDRFNEKGDPLDFLFLSRSCFNGMIRFNSKGGFNVPFCKKRERFSKAYITKIINQIDRFYYLLKFYDWSFVCQDFETTIDTATEEDFIYCDPPYIGRHVDYFNSWKEEDEGRLFQSLSSTRAKFILSTWHSNRYRSNDFLTSLWSRFHIVTQEHFYHVGAKEENRNAMLEALVMNFEPPCKRVEKRRYIQETIFDTL